MKYPVGTIFKSPKGFTTTGEVIAHWDNHYRIHWSDGHGNHVRYTEEMLAEVINICGLSWTLPYTINHDFDEELFNL